MIETIKADLVDENPRPRNVCEHGDHPCPEGLRFCSPECARCEDVGEYGCAGHCRFGLRVLGEAFDQATRVISAHPGSLRGSGLSLERRGDILLLALESRQALVALLLRDSETCPAGTGDASPAADGDTSERMLADLGRLTPDDFERMLNDVAPADMRAWLLERVGVPA